MGREGLAGRRRPGASGVTAAVSSLLKQLLAAPPHVKAAACLKLGVLRL